jgi:hypothetical protein
MDSLENVIVGVGLVSLTCEDRCIASLSKATLGLTPAKVEGSFGRKISCKELRQQGEVFSPAFTLNCLRSATCTRSCVELSGFKIDVFL